MSAGRDANAMMQAGDRRRRREAAARVLPVIGALLCAMPLIWRHDGAWATSVVLTYLLGVWLAMIGCAVILARASADKGQAADDL